MNSMEHMLQQLLTRDAPSSLVHCSHPVDTVGLSPYTCCACAANCNAHCAVDDCCSDPCCYGASGTRCCGHCARLTPCTTASAGPVQ